MDLDIFYFLVSLIFIAGFIDSIAGGGGLITIPVLTLALGGLSAETIGTNKIVGVTAAGFAFLVYLRKGYFDFRKGLYFSFMVALGAFWGSLSAPLVPPEYFKLFLTVTAPVILWVVFRRGLWIQDVKNVKVKRGIFWVLFSGIICGFYDGIWGPGGGTFMLLSLLVFSRIPLMQAMAISKFSNLLSAGTSLIGYSVQGLVQWKFAGVIFVPAMLGSLIGAQMASKRAEKIVRPTLVLVVVLLLIKIWFF